MGRQFLFGVPELTYLDLKPVGGLAGRGGSVRFFLLRNEIEFREKLVTLDAWQKDVKALVQASQNPTGQVPVVTFGNKHLTEHHAILRLFDRELGNYGKDAMHDYHVDRAASASNAWRDGLIAGLFNADAKEKYLSDRPKFFELFTKFMELDHAEGAHVVGKTASYTDDLLFAILWDDSRGYGVEMLPQYPKLQLFFNEYRKHPAVDAWCTEAAAPAVTSPL